MIRIVAHDRQGRRDLQGFEPRRQRRSEAFAASLFAKLPGKPRGERDRVAAEAHAMISGSAGPRRPRETAKASGETITAASSAP